MRTVFGLPITCRCILGGSRQAFRDSTGTDFDALDGCTPEFSQQTARDEKAVGFVLDRHLGAFVRRVAEFGKLANDIVVLRFLCRICRKWQNGLADFDIESFDLWNNAQRESVGRMAENHLHGNLSDSGLMS